MRRARTLGILVLACSVLVTAMVGLRCDDYEATDTTKPDEALEMMRSLPGGGEIFAYYGLGEIREDEDLADLYGDIEDQFQFFGSFGIDLEDVEGMGQGDDTVLLAGSLDLEGIADALMAAGFTEGEVGGVEVWSQPMYGYAVALMDGRVVVGTEDGVEACVGVIEGEESSIYDDVDRREVVERLSEGLAVMCVEGGFDDDQEWDGLLISAMSVKKKSATVADITAVWMFEDADAAKDGLEDIEDFVDEEEDVTLIDLTCDGEFVLGRAEQALEDVFGGDS